MRRQISSLVARIPRSIPLADRELNYKTPWNITISDYYNSMDLHIGVTTSTGTIVEFDRHGLLRHMNDQWNQCLLVDQAAMPWREHWDKTLLQVCKQKCWLSKNYNEERNNCYSFVLTFLQTLNYGNLSAAASSKTFFCETYIVPRTTSAGKYISLYRKLKDGRFCVHKSACK
ncbi:hypothetical protein FQR65_LT09943 [Abscondita terminalis]|nr:hypothetical protein FQR65_LT09943 [Abscondita terminalis]